MPKNKLKKDRSRGTRYAYENPQKNISLFLCKESLIFHLSLIQSVNILLILFFCRHPSFKSIVQLIIYVTECNNGFKN